MSRFGFLARKPGPAEKPNEPATANENPLELDEELFSALGAQLGGENEALRNMLLDANNKINELDTIKAAVGKLVDPVSKALRDFEAEKTEKVGLQTVLNNTRTAYGKLRNEVGDLEKKLAAADGQNKTLRQDLAAAQSLLATLEASKTDFTIDLAASDGLAAAVEELHRILGDAPLHALINNAGYSPKSEDGKRLGCLDGDLGIWQKTFAINLMAPVFFSRACAPLLRETGGSIVNITSIAGHRVHPFAGSAYSTSKAALTALTRELAADLAHMGIRVNAETLRRQLEITGQLDFLKWPYHQAIVKGEVPLSIGGGIGQSRTYMLLLKKAHLGEVSVTVWPQILKDMCREKNIHVLE